MPAQPRSRRGKRAESGPITGILARTVQPAGERTDCFLYLRRLAAKRVRTHQCGARLPERTGLHLLPQLSDPPFLIEIHFNANNAPACRRSDFGPPVSAVDPIQMRDARG